MRADELRARDVTIARHELGLAAEAAPGQVFGECSLCAAGLADEQHGFASGESGQGLGDDAAHLRGEQQPVSQLLSRLA